MDATPAEQRLEEAIRNRAEARRLSSARDRMVPTLQAARQAVFERESAVVREQADVERLQRTSFSRVLASMAGGLSDKIAREQAEVDQARYALGEAQLKLTELQREASVLEAELATLGGVEATDRRYEEALAEVVAQADAGRSSAITADAQRRVEARRRVREIDEALTAGADALAELKAARKRFSSADGWSTYDTFLGGGLISSLIKHDEMDSATKHLRAAGAAVERFSRELGDVDLPGLSLPEVDSFDRTVDMVFDNIFTDLKVADHIRRAMAAVDTTIEQIGQTVARLRVDRMQSDR